MSLWRRVSRLEATSNGPSGASLIPESDGGSFRTPDQILAVSNEVALLQALLEEAKSAVASAEGVIERLQSENASLRRDCRHKRMQLQLVRGGLERAVAFNDTLMAELRVARKLEDKVEQR